LQDKFHAIGRVKKTLQSWHPDFAAALAQLRDIFRNVKPGRGVCATPQATDCVLPWISSAQMDWIPV